MTLIRARTDVGDYSVRLSVDPAKFEPGSYSGFVEVSSPYTTTSRTPISISRSESNMLWPIGIGVVGGLAGLIWLWLLNRARGATALIKRPQYLIVFTAAAVAGIIAVGTTLRRPGGLDCR